MTLHHADCGGVWDRLRPPYESPTAWGHVRYRCSVCGREQEAPIVAGHAVVSATVLMPEGEG